MDFRDHFVQKALDKAVGRYRPEKTVRSRIARMAVIAAVALCAFAGFWAALHHSTPKPRAAAPCSSASWRACRSGSVGHRPA